METLVKQSSVTGQSIGGTLPTTPVLIIGGSLVGLSTALFLGQQGVPTVVVERHLGSSPHPRAIGYTARTLELFRAVGLGEAIPQAPATFRLRRATVESLAGQWHEETPWTPEQKANAAKQPPAAITDYSPCTGAAIAQDKLEPLLRERAQALGADLRLGTELVSFEQDAAGVTAQLRERATGREYELRAAYLVAADGTNSPVREALGIGRQGLGLLRTMRSVLFRAPLEEYLQAGVHQFEIEQPGLSAFLTTYNDGRWVLMFTDEVERDDATLLDVIYRAIGRTDVPVEIITTGCWELSGLVTERFAAGRVLLAGDAAHTLPPTRGGFGANTGIQDAHNLAWKLAAVLAGRAAPALLATYDAERRPVAQVRYEQTFARPDYAAYLPAGTPQEPIIDDMAMEFGQLYRSAAVLGAGPALPPAQRPNQWAGQPGTRAPHVWITRNGQRLSTLDLFQPGWVLLANDDAWTPAAAQVSEQLGLDLTSVRLGEEVESEEPGALPAAFGLGRGGASLVRPDGYIAWRAEELPADPQAALLEALGQVAFAAPQAVAVSA